MPIGVRNLSYNYVLKIQLQGSIQNPKFDTGPAAAKIANTIRQLDQAFTAYLTLDTIYQKY